MLADFFSILLKSLKLAAALPHGFGQFPWIPAFFSASLRAEIFPPVQFFVQRQTGWHRHLAKLPCKLLSLHDKGPSRVRTIDDLMV